MKTLKNDNDVNTRVGKRKKRSKAKRIFWGILAVLLLGIAGFAYYEYHVREYWVRSYQIVSFDMILPSVCFNSFNI
ncbi:MAG: hypothetical protein SPF31_08135 [Lactobacillus delbrueckii]|nr:hypothetical protein [Lactobacillus delbrueckii]MDY5603658.1 hypothetical protein [Lactobacillus delbrueckii]